MLSLYKILTFLSTPLLFALLFWRKIKGKEDAKRVKERRGIASLPCPKGHLIWLHAASVGEAQSALILIDRIQKLRPDIHFLVTSGTVTSANLMASRLPKKAFHQYVPLDHSLWINRFLDHWQPDLVLWMESELWPCTLDNIRRRNIPALLINARLSDQSFIRWKTIKNFATKILSAFHLIMTQTEKDATRYQEIGAPHVIATDNIKYSAMPLPYRESDLENLKQSIAGRPVWLYASTHDGEETLASTLHNSLRQKFPNLLTILVLRHPERRERLKNLSTNILFRGQDHHLPDTNTKIYIVDTLGELGLFYRLCDIAVIGRSFSHDGGGGHNPIEAAQLHCAILTGPHIQYQKEIFDALFQYNAALQVKTEKEFEEKLSLLLSDSAFKKQYQQNAYDFSIAKNKAVDDVINNIMPFLPKGQRYD